MKIEVLDQAERDLIEGFHFYDEQRVGLGSYFLENLLRRYRISPHLRRHSQQTVQGLLSPPIAKISFRGFLQNAGGDGLHPRDS